MHDVHWKEGMLLLPQHLQQFRGFVLGRVAAAGQLGGPGRYGVRALEWRLSPEELAVIAADVTLPSGTIIQVPRACHIPSLPLGEALARSRGSVDVWIGVPVAAEGVSVEAGEANRMGRFQVQEVTLRDEVDAGLDSERQVEVRRLNARLFLGDQDRSGYESVRVARLIRKSDLDPEPAFDPGFVPPLLDVTADPGLKRRLTEICDALRETNESLGRDVASRPFSFALETGASPEAIFKLNATNAQLAVIEQLCLTRGVHPFDTFLALCQLAGSLAIFSQERRCPDVPAYDHDELEVCFQAVIEQIRGYLQYTWKRVFEVREFTEAEGQRPRAALEPTWVEPGSQLYLAAKGGAADPEELDRYVGQQLKLFGQGDKASGLAVGGVRLAREVRVPAALPELEGVYYYRLDREATPTERWAVLRDSLGAELVHAGRPIEGVTYALYAVPRT